MLYEELDHVVLYYIGSLTFDLVQAQNGTVKTHTASKQIVDIPQNVKVRHW